MLAKHNALAGKTVLLTGAAHRLGAATARTLHAAGMNLCLHYRHSAAAAQTLGEELNAIRASSVVLLQADLLDTPQLTRLAQQAYAAWGRLDALINNASTFYPTPMGSVTETHWNDLIGSNLKAPFFLSQAAAPLLADSGGCIINLVDIHADRPLKKHPVYCMAKAGLVMMTKSLARELGPQVRVTGVAPGAILWPEHGLDEHTKQEILDRTALKRHGDPQDIADTILFLIRDAGYISGQIITVDGGRSVHN